MSRGALQVGLLMQEASVLVIKTIAVATAYRRAVAMSRGLRRLPG